MTKKWNPIVDTGDRPKYIALVETIESEIAAGVLSSGMRLPSNRELSEMFGMTIATVTKAMAEAGRRGLVEARVGSGTFIREAVSVTGTSSQTEPVDLALNILPTSVVQDLLQDSLAQLTPARLSENLFSYSSYMNAEHHRKLGADWIASFGMEVDAEHVLLTTGVHQGLLAAFRVLLAPGDSAICEGVTYTGIKRIADYRGVKLIGAECDAQGLVPDSVERELKRTNAKVLIVTPTLQNPSTATLPLDRRRALVEICLKNDVQIIEDAINVPLANDNLPSLAVLAADRTIYLTGYSKCIASGFRLGYAVVPLRLRDGFREALASTQWIGPGFFAELAMSMFSGGVIDQCIARHRSEATARTTLARDILKGVQISPSPAYHVWVKTPDHWTPDDFSMHALRLGIKVSPASHFTVPPTVAPNAYRVSLGAIATTTELESALRRLDRIGSENHAIFDTLI
jgi:DNA-binding transcriptional MocR family regulator